MNAEMMHQTEIQFIVALHPNGRAMMTRDMELIRKIFAEIRSRKDASWRAVEIPGEDEWRVAKHLELLIEAGLVEAQRGGAYNDPFPKFSVKDLTMVGHDFAATLENDTVWTKLKNAYSGAELAELPIRVVQTDL
jgi:hypothetical protein